jgi:glutamate synthase (NADPH) large chain
VSIPSSLWHRGKTDDEQLKRLISDHLQWTGSTRARHILDNWAESRAKFVKVFPSEYQRALREMGAAKEAGESIAKAKTVEPVSSVAPSKLTAKK